MEHGGNIETYGRGHPELLTDFSANINPLGIDPRLEAAMHRALSAADRYPDFTYRRLRRALSEYLHCAPEAVVAGNGAMEIIAGSIALFPRIYLATPCFNEYARIAKSRGIAVYTFEMAPPFRLCVPEFIEKMPENALTILTDPNNPTGYTLSDSEREAIYRAVVEKGGHLLLDETFMEFVRPPSEECSFYDEKDRLITVRAATKFFALPGIRLGYGILPAGIRKRYLARQLPWMVNVLAEEAGLWLKSLDAYGERTRAYVQRERERLATCFQKSKIAEAYPSEANFLLIRLQAPVAKRCFQFFLERHILLRIYPAGGVLADRYMRIAVRTAEENTRFMAVWREFERSVADV